MKIRELFEADKPLDLADVEPTAADPAAAEAPPAEEEPSDIEKTEVPAEEEKPDEPETIDELFEANSDKVKTYQQITTWDAKKLEKDTKITANGKVTRAKAGQVVVRNHANITEFKLISAEDYKTKYVPVRPSAKPDAEGFLLVKEKGNIDAFQYEGDDLTVKNGKDEDVEVTDGQYVCKYTDDKKSGWAVEESEFTNVYKIKHK